MTLSYSNLTQIKVSIQQGIVLGPVSYLYACDLPKLKIILKKLINYIMLSINFKIVLRNGKSNIMKEMSFY